MPGQCRKLGRTQAVIWALLMLAALPGRAQSPEELVRWIYTSMAQLSPGQASGLAYLSAPAQRGQFLSERLAGFYAANGTYGDDLARACVDFDFAIPGNDYDGAEILRTLSVSAAGDARRRTVTADFVNFGTPARVAYEFVPEGGFWRLDDIAGPGFRVSEIPCAPKPAAAPEGGGTGYCYATQGDQLRMEIAADGRGTFALESWQGGGHSCGAEGALAPIPGGWVYEETLFSGPCRLEILVTPEGGLRLTDVQSGCKVSLCGQRAMLDGLSFARSAQVDCATLPRP